MFPEPPKGYQNVPTATVALTGLDARCVSTAIRPCQVYQQSGYLHGVYKTVESPDSFLQLRLLHIQLLPAKCVQCDGVGSTACQCADQGEAHV